MNIYCEKYAYENKDELLAKAKEMKEKGWFVRKMWYDKIAKTNILEVCK